MSGALLVIGNRNYSSWSLRAWLALRHCGFEFDTHRLALDTPVFTSQVRAFSGAGRVPVLVEHGTSIWDSLAIAEFAAERTGRGWPGDPIARAIARSAACEMHSGFAALRQAWPLDIRARRPGTATSNEVRADLMRIDALWGDCRTRFGADGPWLFGRYSIADAYYAPVVCRIKTYGDPGLSEISATYCATTLGDPELVAWSALAAEESEVLV